LQSTHRQDGQAGETTTACRTQQEAKRTQQDAETTTACRTQHESKAHPARSRNEYSLPHPIEIKKSTSKKQK
jgi:hypothetical protein